MDVYLLGLWSPSHKLIWRGRELLGRRFTLFGEGERERERTTADIDTIMAVGEPCGFDSETPLANAAPNRTTSLPVWMNVTPSSHRVGAERAFAAGHYTAPMR
jgi:hypothetical protein